MIKSMQYGAEEAAWIKGRGILKEAYDKAVEGGMDEDDILQQVYMLVTHKTDFGPTAKRESRYALQLRRTAHTSNEGGVA
jgi:hypothetical protein